MPTPYYNENGRYTTQLSDGTDVDVVNYNVYTSPEMTELIAANQLESQYFDGTDYQCWHISNPALLSTETLGGYMSANSVGALPKPKGSNNPGGSPIKY